MFVFGFVNCAANMIQLGTIWEDSSTPPQIWKQHAIQLHIHARSYNTKIFKCLGANLRTVQRIVQKELDESNEDYESIAALKPCSDCTETKRTLDL